MSPPPPPPPPAPSCALSGDVRGANFFGHNSPDKIHYHQPHTHETNGPHECSYNYSNSKLVGLKANPGGSAYQTMIDRFCGHTANIAKDIPGGIICAESAVGSSIARTYCGEGANIITETSVCDSGEPLGQQGYRDLLGTYCTANNSHIKDSSHVCSTIKTFNPTLYDSIAKAFCEANPNDSFCSCYNVLNDKCDPTSKSGVAGCSETASYVDLRKCNTRRFQRCLGWSKKMWLCLCRS